MALRAQGITKGGCVEKVHPLSRNQIKTIKTIRTCLQATHTDIQTQNDAAWSLRSGWNQQRAAHAKPARVTGYCSFTALADRWCDRCRGWTAVVL